MSSYTEEDQAMIPKKYSQRIQNVLTGTIIIIALTSCMNRKKSDDGGGGNRPSPAANFPAGAAPCVNLFGIQGQDARGPFTGFLYLNGSSFSRHVEYSKPIEDERTLTWLVSGSVASNGNSLNLTSSLARNSHVIKYKSITRNDSDKTSVNFQGQIQFNSSNCTGQGVYAVGSENFTETFSSPSNDYGKEIAWIAVNRKEALITDPPTAATKLAMFASFKSFMDLPTVTPYQNRPEFAQAAQIAVIDTTDFDYYRAHPNHIRVRQAPIDPITTADAMSRANAYRYNLAQKAALADKLMETRYFDHDTKQLPLGIGDVARHVFSKPILSP
jgi:hypothetical protein